MEGLPGGAPDAAAAAAPLPPPQLDLRLYAPAGEPELGRGAFGRVELYALQPGAEVLPETPATLAVKWVTVQAQELYTRGRGCEEIENAMALRHPNICTTYGWLPDEHDATAVRIYMEHVDGPNMLPGAGEQGCDEPTLWNIFRQILAECCTAIEQNLPPGSQGG